MTVESQLPLRDLGTALEEIIESAGQTPQAVGSHGPSQEQARSLYIDIVVKAAAKSILGPGLCRQEEEKYQGKKIVKWFHRAGFGLQSTGRPEDSIVFVVLMKKEAVNHYLKLIFFQPPKRILFLPA